MVKVDYFKYISLLLCFIVLVTGIMLFTNEQQDQPQTELRDFSLYSEISQLLELVGYDPDEGIQEEIETEIRQSIRKSQIISDVEYNEGIAYLNLTEKIYKLNTFKQFDLIEALITDASTISEVESIQFLINSRRLSISPFLDTTQQIKAREEAAKVAIIIDDLGNRAKGTEEIFKLKQKITCAIMPFEKKSTAEAEEAIKRGYDVIIHLPMEAELDRPNWLGPKPILTDLSDQEIKTRMKEAIADIPQAVGFNNHTGGKATANRRVMEQVLQVAKEEGLLAIDSKTTPKSVIQEVAYKLNVPVLERDVFLDHHKDYGYIRKALLRLAGQAIRQGQAIGIGHVGPRGGKVTVLALQNILPRLDQAGIRFVGIDDLEK
ncbi:hypothetical protein JCM15060_11180 [Halanaerobaculum tunisiense]